jgi:hypothetical protein
MEAWDCPACATYNSAHHATCTMCGASRPTQPPASVPPPAPVLPPASVPPGSAGESATVPQPRPPAPPEDASSWLTVDAPPGSESAWPEPSPLPEPPLTQPPFAEPPEQSRRPASRWSAGRLWLALAAVALVAAAAVAVRPVSRWVYDVAFADKTMAPPTPVPTPDGPPPTTPVRSPTASPTTTTTPTPTPSPTGTVVGIVKIDVATDDPAVNGVAETLDDYFSGLNNKDFDRALSTFDPAGIVNPNNPSSAAAFRQAVSTSTDSDVVLRRLAQDNTGKGVLQAQVTFQSNQSAGFGPKGSENETCTRWDVTYILTQPSGTRYRIFGSTTAIHTPC